MIEIKLTLEDFRKAKQLATEMGALRKSITKGSGNMAGFLGEIAACRVYGATINNTYDFDLLLSDGRKADVKTKRTTVAPRPDYDCSVAQYNTRQACDIYIFTRLLIETETVYVLGHYDKLKYFEDARFWLKGELDPRNNYTVKASCFNMQISQLELP